MPTLLQRLSSEALGTALLLAAIVGSGIMVELPAPPASTAVALLPHALSVSAMLYVLINVFAPISGAHFNPAVTFMFVARRELTPKEGALYVCVQLIGALVGVWMAHRMFDLPILQVSDRARLSSGLLFSELIATFGLCLIILLAAARHELSVASCVSTFIFAALWFTASTAFANPAVTLARALSATFTGIRPDHVFGFVAAQLAAVPLALAAARVLLQRRASRNAVARRSVPRLASKYDDPA